jgi:hypothetical protein
LNGAIYALHVAFKLDSISGSAFTPLLKNVKHGTTISRSAQWITSFIEAHSHDMLFVPGCTFAMQNSSNEFILKCKPLQDQRNQINYGCGNNDMIFDHTSKAFLGERITLF